MADRRLFLKTAGGAAIATPTVLALGQVPSYASTTSGPVVIDGFTVAQDETTGTVTGAMIGGSREAIPFSGGTFEIAGGMLTTSTQGGVQLRWGPVGGPTIADLSGCTEILLEGADASLAIDFRLASGGDTVSASESQDPDGAVVSLADYTADGIDLTMINRFVLTLNGAQTMGRIIAR